MKLSIRALGVVLFVAQLFAASSVVAQSWSFEDVNAQIGSSTVEVDWTFEAGGGVEGIGVDVVFDNALIDPQVTGTDVDGCFENVTAQVPESCQLINPTTVRITISNFPGNELVSANGSITFDIAGSAAVDDVSGLNLTVASVVPSGTEVALNNGSVTITSGPQPALSFAPTSGSLLDFDGVQNGQSETLDVEVCNANTGDAGSVISNIVGTAPTSEFVVDNSACSGLSLSPGQCCDVSVTFSPSAGDSTPFNDTLSIDTSAGAGTFPLEGTGENGPAAALSIVESSFDFGDLLTGDESAETTFTVRNSSSSAGSNLSVDTIGGLAPPFTISGGTCVAGTTTLATGAECTVDVTFAPTADGLVTQSLSVDGTDTINGTALSDSETVEGTGVTRPIFSSDPAPDAGAISLGTTTPGASLGPLTVDVTNDGNGPLDVTCQAPTGDTEQVTIETFSVTGLAAGGTDSFTVSCDVPEQATYTASMECTTNEPSTNGEISYLYEFSCSAQPLVVPTMQNWGLILMALMMLLVGGFSIRFFRT